MAILFSIVLLLCTPAEAGSTDCKMVRLTHPFAGGAAECTDFGARLRQRLSPPYFLGAFTCVPAGPEA